MEKPSWTPIVFSGAIPRELSDLLAILIMGIAAIESSLASISIAIVGSGPWLALLVVPPACALASLSNTTRRTKEELALFAYGGSSWQIYLRYFLRGVICSLIAFTPIILQAFLVTSSVSFDKLELVILPLLAGGLFYSLPSLHRIRSNRFVEHYKS